MNGCHLLSDVRIASPSLSGDKAELLSPFCEQPDRADGSMEKASMYKVDYWT